VIRIGPGLMLDETEIEESFIRASGPGGQHVNKTSSAVQLRFDVRGSRSLPNDVAARLMKLAGARLTQDGILVITVQSTRSQKRNREEALGRLVELIREAAVRPAVRRPTKATAASRRRRLQAKKQRGETKILRRSPPRD
jgi:ribosome-associated protein